MRKTAELVAPGGSLTAALYALKHGADAVYVGLTEFSARAHARNLTLEQLARLKEFAVKSGKRIYVTLNTLIKDCETDRIARILWELSFLEIDAVVVQDLGLLYLTRRLFPSTRVHASTQMAVHNPGGVRYLEALGVKRVILSRELSFPEIKAIREQNPAMELEAFIHGSLCYGFSGLCLASGIICGRSGNRGDCAQVCRTWFQGPRGKGYYFSCNDLQLAREVLMLKEIGIDAFKIEGRMKSPEYTGTTVSLYRHILDNAPSEEIEHDMCTAQGIFSRIPTPAFFNNPKGERMINRNYPFPMGIPAGCVDATEKGGFHMMLEQPIMMRDGLLFFNEGNPPEPVHFGVKGMRMGNRKVFSAVEGERVFIESPSPPRVGDVIRKISIHNLHWPAIKEGGMKPWKRPVDLIITLSDGRMDISTTPPVPIPLNPPTPITLTFPVSIERALRERPFQEILEKILGESGNSPFKPGSIRLANTTSFEDDRIYIHPSQLKSLKNSWYEHLQAQYGSVMEAALQRIQEPVPGRPAQDPFPSDPVQTMQSRAHLPPRSRIIPSDSDPIPFVVDTDTLVLKNLPLIGGLCFLPLHPIIFHEREYLEGLVRFVKNHNEQSFAIGLNNIAHLSWVPTLTALPNTFFFIDYGLYCANRWSFQFFLEHIPRLLFQYLWIEGGDEDLSGIQAKPEKTSIPLVPIDRSFHPPLFMSRVCFVRHGLESGCPDGCPRNFRYRLSQNKKRFMVIVRNCMSYLFSGLPSS